jgi:hypothetical protein
LEWDFRLLATIGASSGELLLRTIAIAASTTAAIKRLLFKLSAGWAPHGCVLEAFFSVEFLF